LDKRIRDLVRTVVQMHRHVGCDEIAPIVLENSKMSEPVHIAEILPEVMAEKSRRPPVNISLYHPR